MFSLPHYHTLNPKLLAREPLHFVSMASAALQSCWHIPLSELGQFSRDAALSDAPSRGWGLCRPKYWDFHLEMGETLTICIMKRSWHYLGLCMCPLLMDLSCTVATGTSGSESQSCLMIIKVHLASLYWLFICHWHQNNNEGNLSKMSVFSTSDPLYISEFFVIVIQESPLNCRLAAMAMRFAFADLKHGTESSRSFHISPKAAAVFWSFVILPWKKRARKSSLTCVGWEEVLPSFLLFPSPQKSRFPLSCLNLNEGRKVVHGMLVWGFYADLQWGSWRCWNHECWLAFRDPWYPYPPSFSWGLFYLVGHSLICVERVHWREVGGNAKGRD